MNRTDWLCIAQTFLFVCVVTACTAADNNWPQFRGYGAIGIGSGNPPVRWNVDADENVLWKTPIPGLGHSAPIVWDDRVFLTTAVNTRTEHPAVETGWSGGAGESAKDSGEWTWKVICLSLGTGQILWTEDASTGTPRIKRHLKASHANCTPVTNGKYVVAFFGSEGLYCYDINGKPIWKHDFGKLHSGPYDSPELEWGFASSPIIHGDHLIVQCDCLNDNFVSIMNLKTGKEIRRIQRDGEVATWSTPLVVESEDQTQLVCNGYKQMASYDVETGERLWHLSGGGDVPVPTPLYSEGLIFLTNGHARSHTYAIKPTATGNLTPEGDSDVDGIAWWQSRDGSYMPTPLIYDGLLYTCNDNGRLTVREAATGDLVYRQRIGSGRRTYSASAVAGGGHLYFVSEAGEVTVVQAGRQYNQVGSNDMNEVVMATPAISGNRLLIRGVRHLYCLESTP